MAMLPARRRGQNLTVLDPLGEFEDIRDRMGQLMNMAFGNAGLASLADMPWSPLADVSETDDAYVVQVELPGVSKDQIDVQLQDRELDISGEVKENGEGKQRQSSRRTGRFEYRTYLPGDVKADQVSAQLADGVLTVTVPKSEAAKPRRIEVQARNGSG
jgi:HSP20 family protein